MSARGRFFAGSITGGHIGPPLRGTGGVRGGVRLGCGFRQPNFGTKFGASVMGIGPYAPRGDEGRHAGSSCPTGGCGEPPRLPWVAAHSGASAAQTGGTGGNRGRDHPKSVQQRRTIPQSRLRRASFLCTREPLRTGDADCRVASLLAMTTVFCHSEASAHTDRGNPSFLRWTGVRAAVPRAWPPPTKFRTEIWGVGQVVGPYGKPNQPPKPAARSEAFAPAGARDG